MEVIKEITLNIKDLFENHFLKNRKRVMKNYKRIVIYIAFFIATIIFLSFIIYMVVNIKFKLILFELFNLNFTIYIYCPEKFKNKKSTKMKLCNKKDKK